VSPFAGDVGTAIWTLVIFLLVVLVLGKFAWNPVLKALQGREDFIRDALAKAKEDREAAEARLAEYTQKVEGAQREAQAIVDRARTDGTAVKTRLEEEARREAERLVERAREEIGIAKNAAIRDLYALSGNLAIDVASRILRRELDASSHQTLIDEALRELEQKSSSGSRDAGVQ
jgi:F-type H+-transporting ATPase subunit b